MLLNSTTRRDFSFVAVNKYDSYDLCPFHVLLVFLHLSSLPELRNSLFNRFGIAVKKFILLYLTTKSLFITSDCFLFQMEKCFPNQGSDYSIMSSTGWIMKVEMPVLQNWEISGEIFSFQISGALSHSVHFVFTSWKAGTSSWLLAPLWWGKKNEKARFGVDPGVDQELFMKVWERKTKIRGLRLILGLIKSFLWKFGSTEVQRKCFTNHGELQQGRDRSEASFQKHPRVQFGVHGSKIRSPGGWSQKCSFHVTGISYLLYTEQHKLTFYTFIFSSYLLSVASIYFSVSQYSWLWRNSFHNQGGEKKKKTLETLPLQHQEEKCFQNCYKQELQVPPSCSLPVALQAAFHHCLWVFLQDSLLLITSQQSRIKHIWLLFMWALSH